MVLCFFSNVTGQTKLNKPLLEKVHISYKVARKAVLKPSLSESGHYTEPHIHSHTPTKAPRACVHNISLYTFGISGVSHQSPNWQLQKGRGGSPPAGSHVPAWSPRTTEPCSDSIFPRVPACFPSPAPSMGFSERVRNRTWGEVSHDNYLRVIQQWILQKGDGRDSD